MPSESQVLYFHMIIRADDDGVVESYPLMKLLGMAPDNFKVLIAKGFIRELNEDQVVVISDWLEHNTIRADRKVNSIYTHLLKEKAPDLPLLEAKPRSDVEDNSKRIEMSDSGRSTGSRSKVKLSKVKLTLPPVAGSENVVVEEKPFVSSEEVTKLVTSVRVDMKILGLYFRKKGYEFRNKEQLGIAVRREIKFASDLKHFDADQLRMAFDKTQKHAAEMKYDWKLSTVLKFIN